MSKKLEIETRIARENCALDAGVLELGQLSPFTCPECHGVLVQLQDGDFKRFRCHTGHAFSLSSLLAEVTQSLEDSLWITLRTIQESALLLQHLARHARDRHEDGVAELAERKAREAELSTDVIRDLLGRREALSEDQLRDAAG